MLSIKICVLSRGSFIISLNYINININGAQYTCFMAIEDHLSTKTSFAQIAGRPGRYALSFRPPLPGRLWCPLDGFVYSTWYPGGGKYSQPKRTLFVPSGPASPYATNEARQSALSSVVDTLKPVMPSPPQSFSGKT